MEAIEIKPQTRHIQTIAEMVHIHNEFVRAGFKRGGFVEIVREITGQYLDNEGEKLLIRWWNFRVSDPDLNTKIDHVLETIKKE